jgi:heme/copper-type cytochrome/quinol oxidase subunit 4
MWFVLMCIIMVITVVGLFFVMEENNKKWK